MQVQTNTNPGCCGALWQDDDGDGKFTKVSGADMVIATVLEVV